MTDRHLTSVTRRQAVTRIAASVALGTALAAAFVIHGISSSDAAKVSPAPIGTASAQLSVLRKGPVDTTAPPEVQAGLADASADANGIRLLGTAPGDGGLSLYAAARSNGGACNALGSSKGPVGTVCADTLPLEGVTVTASDAGGWIVYGFAADGVVSVDVVVDGKPLPATMLANAYAADLGASGPGDATALVVHYADGTSTSLRTGLQAPPSA